MRYILITTLLIFIGGCSLLNPYNKSDFDKTYSSEGNINMVVEIPAGTNKKYEYNYKNKKFIVDIKNGEERIIDFLSYPGNYGFIPSTIVSQEDGGDGDAVDVLLISEHLPTGSVIEILPIALLHLEDGGENDSKIIAVPVDESKRIINASSYQELISKYPKVVSIITEWFINYKGSEIIEFKGWEDELYAKEKILKWQINI